MRIAVIDPAAGVSGDMLLGALIDLGADRQWLLDLPERLGFENVTVDIRAVERCSVSATSVKFLIDGRPETGGHGAGHGHGRHIANLIETVQSADLDEDVRGLSERVFLALGNAEGRVHGVDAEKVHLHEVGATDAVLDIVGTLEGFRRLGVERVFSRPIALGDGWVDAAHGRLPVPAPATSFLLEGMRVVGGSHVRGEATTPTGAALVKVLTEGREPPENWRVVSNGWGAGSREAEGYPNALRIMLGELAPEGAEVEVIITDIDDLQPEYIEPLREAVTAAGALDCSVWATQGKKGRTGFRVEILAPPGQADSIAEEVFRNSTTGGVRRMRMLRQTLDRSVWPVEVAPGVTVRVKQLKGDGERLKAEYDDVVRAAAALRKPALDVARYAEAIAAKNKAGLTVS